MFKRSARIARQILEVLSALYPDPRPHLNFSSPWELLVATVLSAQCTDERVNQITPDLFRHLPSVQDFAKAGQEEVEKLIRSVGFYRNKARHLISAARRIVSAYRGEVPRSLRELVTLDGVARKSANVVLCGAFGLNEGLAVDTHVARISARLGLVDHGLSTQRIEQKLCALFPQAEWGRLNHRLVSFGREVCSARKPRCPDCPLLGCCPRIGVEGQGQALSPESCMIHLGKDQQAG